MYKPTQKMNILLISGSRSGGRAIQAQLSQSDVHLAVWQFMSLEDAQSFSSEDNGLIHMGILDLCCFSDNGHDPKSAFLRFKKRLVTTPIIVITDRDDEDLIHFSMQEGAAYSVSFWQIKSDPHHLMNLISTSLIHLSMNDEIRKDEDNALHASASKYDWLLEHLNASKARFDLLKKVNGSDTMASKIYTSSEY